MAFAIKDNTLELWTDPFDVPQYHSARFNYQMIKRQEGPSIRVRLQASQTEDDQYFNVDYFLPSGWQTFATLGKQLVPEYTVDYGALVEQCRPIARNVLEMFRRHL